jgi:hypothetical protein
MGAQQVLDLGRIDILAARMIMSRRRPPAITTRALRRGHAEITGFSQPSGRRFRGSAGLL